MQKIRPDLGIGQNIRKYRIAQKLSQDAVMAKLQLMGISISRSTYAKIETNRMNIRVSELVGLREILGIEFNDLFAGIALMEE